MHELYPIIRRVRRPLLLEDPSPVVKPPTVAENPPAPEQPEPPKDADKTGNPSED